MLSPRASMPSSSVLTPTRMTKSESVRNGTDATSAVNSARRATGGTVVQAASARPSAPPRRSRLSSALATHSSTPTLATSDLLERRGAEQSAGPDQHHED